MNITTKGRYALRVMTDLAVHKDEGFIPLSAISQRQDLSAKYLEMIVSALKKGGLVVSSRGKEGGYRLSRPPEELTVGDILRAADDSLAPVSCVKEGQPGCERAGHCLSLPMWQELDGIISSYLDSVYLSDLVSGQRWSGENKNSGHY